MKTTILYLTILFISFSLGGFCQTRDTLKERKIEEQLNQINPQLVEYFKNATIAFDNQDYFMADSLYTIVYKNAPTFDPAIRRLGSLKVFQGSKLYGIELCEKAVNINRSSENVITLCSNLLTTPKNDEPNYNDFSNALTLLKEGITLPGADEIEYLTLTGQATLILGNMNEFRAVSKKLLEKHPDQMVSHYFTAIAAADNEEWETAYKEILIAKDLGLPQEDVDYFLASGVESNYSIWHYIHISIWIFVSWITGLIILLILGTILSSYTISSLELNLKATNPSQVWKFVRFFYKGLINISGVYYYISQPFIMILLIAIVVAVIYMFLMIGRIPIYLTLLLIGGSCFTIYAMFKTLLIKRNATEPGRELKEEEAPELFKMVKAVANTIGTRPIEEIRITHETDLAVYEKGSWKDKMQDKAKRILILGIGILKEFKQNDFKAVIAHEYGHFANRDTAGGSFALRVRNDMFLYIITLYQSGLSSWWNIAFHFLRLYDYIFRKISNGATRLQEIMADRVAAKTFGTLAFQNGLTYVTRRSLEFTMLANKEIEIANQAKRSFNNLYELSGNPGENFEEEINKALNRKTNNNDTHPSPKDRFKLIEGLASGNNSGNDIFIKDYFKNWDTVTREMTALIEKMVNNK